MNKVSSFWFWVIAILSVAMSVSTFLAVAWVVWKVLLFIGII